MITLFTADTHFSANPRDAYRFHFLEETLPRLIEVHKVVRLIVGGDVAEAKDGHTSALVNRVADGFARLTQVVDVIGYTGNHDYLRADVPFWRFLQHIPRVRWINEPTPLKLRGLGNCLFLPHAPHPSDAWKSWLTKPYDWYFCHQTFSGAVSESGRELEGMPAGIFPRGARVVSGDVHVPQKVGPVTYAGAPYHVDFGDTFEPRVLLLDGDKVRSVPVDGPQKRLVVVPEFPGILDPRMGRTHPSIRKLQVYEGDVVKIRIDLPAGSDVSHAQVRATAREWAEEAGVQLCGVQVIAPKPEQSEKAAARRDRRTDADLVRAYARKMGKGKVTLAAGLKIAEEVA